jgi:hypothetical protein
MIKSSLTTPTAAPTAKPTAQTIANQQTDSTDSTTGVHVCAHTHTTYNVVSVLSVVSVDGIKKYKSNTYKPTSTPTAKKPSVGNDDLVLATWQTAAGCNTPVMQAAAQSFARLDHLAYWCYQLAVVGDRTSYEHVSSVVRLGVLVLVDHYKLHHSYANGIVNTIMYEIQMPCTARPFSGRQRAAASEEIAQKTWSRNKMCRIVDAIIKELDAALDRADRLTRDQTIEAITQ